MRKGELLIGFGLFALGMLALVTGVVGLDDGSASGTPNAIRGTSGGIVVANDAGGGEVYSGPQDPATDTVADTGPAGPTASLQPMTPSLPPAAASGPPIVADVSSASMEVSPSWDDDSDDRAQRHEKDKPDSKEKPDKSKDKPDKEDKQGGDKHHKDKHDRHDKDERHDD